MVEGGENEPWLLIERSPAEGNPAEALGDESDTLKLRVGSKGGALLDNVDEPMELVERDIDDDDVDWERIVLVECDNAGVAEWENPEAIDEEDECKSPGGCDSTEALRSLLNR